MRALVQPAVAVLILAGFLSPFGAAQRTQTSPKSPPGAPSATQNPGTSAQESEEEIRKQEQSRRILGVVPMFGVTSRQNAPPLSPREKFHLFVKSSFDPFEYVAVGFQAGISQATDEFPGYGQGAEGYGKRYGATLADQVSSNFFATFFYPVLLKQDPRYFRVGEGTTKHRILYSLRQVLVCHKDSGGQAFNWSNVLGAVSTGGLSNAYYPQSDRGFGLTMSRSAISLLYGSAGGLIEEFWPDIHRKLFQKKSKPTP